VPRKRLHFAAYLSVLPPFYPAKSSSSTRHIVPHNKPSPATHAADPGLPLQHHQAEPPRDSVNTLPQLVTSPHLKRFGLRGCPPSKALPTAHVCETVTPSSMSRSSTHESWVMTRPRPEQNLLYRNSASRAQRAPRQTARPRSLPSTQPLVPHLFRCIHGISLHGASPHSAPQLHDKASMTSAQLRATTPPKNHERTCLRRSSTPTPMLFQNPRFGVIANLAESAPTTHRVLVSNANQFPVNFNDVRNR
jgi:hypothetical protein